MAEFIGRQGGLFFEVKHSPEEKKQIEEYKKIESLIDRVEELEFQNQLLWKEIQLLKGARNE